MVENNIATAPKTNDVSGNMNSTFDSSETSNNSKLMRGILIGSVIGGVVAMLDTNTRNKVKGTAINVKDSSMNMISEVKNNPSDVKEQMVNSFKEASNVMKEAINDAQRLYERVNNDMFGKVSDVKEITNQAMNTAVDAKSEISEIGSKVKEAGSTMMENPVVEAAGSSNTGHSSESNSYEGGSNHDDFRGLGAENANSVGTYGKGIDNPPADTPGTGVTSNIRAVSPKEQNNDNNR